MNAETNMHIILRMPIRIIMVEIRFHIWQSSQSQLLLLLYRTLRLCQ